MALLLIAVLIFLAVPRTVAVIDFPDQFDNADHWKLYRGPEELKQMIDPQIGLPAPSLMIPAAGSIVPDPPGFGDNVTSVYLWNPDTSRLANFTLDFWIYFDDTVGSGGRAMVTFRMQDDRNYYAAYLSDDKTWTSRMMKFSDDKGNVLGETRDRGIFAPQTWSHVSLEVQGSKFNLSKDGSLILTASDSQWLAGITYGIGIYNGFTGHSFHIDNLELVTCETLCYVSMSTKTSILTSLETQTSTVTTTSVSVTTMPMTTTSTIAIPINVLTTATSTRTVGLLLPVVDSSSFFVLLGVGLFFGACADTKRFGKAMYVAITLFAAILLGGSWLSNWTALFLQASFAALIGVAVGVLVRLLWQQEPA